MLSNDSYHSIKRVSAHLLKIFKESVKEYILELNNPTQKKKKYLELGKQVHMSLLEPDKFKETYILSTFEQELTPSTEQQRLFCYGFMAYPSEEESSHTSDVYSKTYKIERKSPKKIKEEADALYERFKTYIDYLREINTGKIVLPKNLADNLKEAKTTILAHKKAKELLSIEPIEFADDSIKTYNELEILWEFKAELCTVECKSKPDRVIIDTKNRIIKLIDLKTSASLYNFSDTIKNLGYDLQLAFYWLAITNWFLKTFPDEKIEDYKQETYIVAIRTLGISECKVYQVSTTALDENVTKIVGLLNDLSWHITNDKWEYSRSYYEGDGVEVI